MKGWIVGGTILAGLLFGAVLSAPAQAQAGRQVAAQASAARQAGTGALAQAAPAAPNPAAAAPQAPPSESGSPRRDPFRAIVVKRAVDVAPICTQPGKGSLLVAQLILLGIARSVEGQWIAVVDNKTKRAYFLREKDELCNGVVARITQENLVIEERTMDSFGRTRTREVVLRSPDQ